MIEGSFASEITVVQSEKVECFLCRKRRIHRIAAATAFRIESEVSLPMWFAKECAMGFSRARLAREYADAVRELGGIGDLNDPLRKAFLAGLHV